MTSRVRGWLGRQSAVPGGVERGDLMLFALLTVFAVLATTSTHRVSLAPALSAIAFTLPLLWRRSLPFAATAAFAVGIAVNAAFAHQGARCGAALPTAGILLYSAGLRLDRRRSLAGLALGLVGLLIEDLTDPRLSAATLVALLPLGGAAWWAGRIVRSRTVAAQRLQEQTRLLELQRERTAELAVEVERARIAVDLQDVAHARVQEIIELARAGEAELRDDHMTAGAAFGAIERRSRETLDEIRALLGVLRGEETAARRPQPTLDELQDLLEYARHGGRKVRVEVAGHRRALPASVELSAYRIVQETLGAMDAGAEVQVRVGYGDDALELDVSGRTTASTAEPVSSVVAVRERALMHGGTLTVTSVGPDRRSFHARIPLAVFDA